ncbi:phytanoyl-CoA dioxygenase family protein [Solwaraspora sp. WMMD792]|uniref:phytanoyl-CoA dioxygenase family protein n=1 Tax=Solwaraspora sp. WMMD792 TaxID=3016099 RepID=UPI002415CCFF|nr:phytanoyl-CoA dioxygenase family protein [Solwaraspora sp. WMMD792]MDG4774271.1 phytanoyl-CoA dioxygenase family protein [Solwaraspora sp. WMMD792]
MTTLQMDMFTNPAITDAQLNQFDDQGYLILPGFLPVDLANRLRQEVDRWVDDGLRARSIDSCVDPDKHGTPPLMELEMPTHGELIAYPPLMNLLIRLLGPAFAFHHLHSDRQAPGLPGKAWHHDYEYGPQVDPAHRMVHTLHYLDGLDDGTSSLVVLPGSHRERVAKTARAHLGTTVLPGELNLEQLPARSTVVLHSALFHARRPRPDGRTKDRYFIDTSYCQAGSKWPPVKPYWRRMLQRGRELRLDRGRWPDLFREEHFTEYRRPQQPADSQGRTASARAVRRPGAGR